MALGSVSLLPRSIIKGTVVSRTDFGVFVEIEQGVEDSCTCLSSTTLRRLGRALPRPTRDVRRGSSRRSTCDRKLSLAEVTPAETWLQMLPRAARLPASSSLARPRTRTPALATFLATSQPSLVRRHLE